MPNLYQTVEELDDIAYTGSRSTQLEEGDDDNDYDDDDDSATDAGKGVCGETLGLPSDFCDNERIEYGLETLATYELTIRIGIAFDQLDMIRLAVQHRASLIEHKTKNARTTKTNMAAQADIDEAKGRAQLLAARYNDNYDRITKLRGEDYDARKDEGGGGRLRAIDQDKDLAIANMAVARTLGDSKKSGSWIWSVFEVSEASSTEQAQWFRAKAEKDRADEAVNRHCAEFRRTIKAYDAMSALWRDAAARTDGGERAYAFKTAAMWEGMHRRCALEYERARRNEIPAERLDQTRVCILRHVY
ncbi:hypothetical protein GY45DRAFT_1261276, partial [Cubamyces sp. BRFM 1775]